MKNIVTYINRNHRERLYRLRLLPMLMLSALLILPATVSAGSAAVYSKTVDKRVEAVYPVLYKSLEDARFYVVFEPNIGKNISGFAERWGENYNRNELDEIRSMVFCNGWYANQVSNLDPEMLGFCPLHLTLTERDGKTTVLFNRPTATAKGSAAFELFTELENEVIEAIEAGLQ
jgi:hypothetical protein